MARGEEWVPLTKAACFPAFASQAYVTVGMGALSAHGEALVPATPPGGSLWCGP